MKTKPCAFCGTPYVVRNNNRRYCGDPCRFYSKVDRTPQPEACCKLWKPGEVCCHLWTAAVDSKGYGQIKVDGKLALAHRVAWKLEYGRIPDGLIDYGWAPLCVLHKCDNPLCVNPDHLFLGTHAANMLNMVEKNRQARGEQHGGHKLTEVDVRQIRRDCAGMTLREIAKKFGVYSHSTIYKVLRGVTWKHVTLLDNPINPTIMGS